MNPRTIGFAAGAGACALLWGATAPLGPISSAFAIAAGVLVVATVSSMVRPRRDKYDLSLLREIDEQSRMGEVEEPEQPFDSVVCPRCATVFAHKLHVCPRCGTTV